MSERRECVVAAVVLLTFVVVALLVSSIEGVGSCTDYADGRAGTCDDGGWRLVPPWQ